MSEDQFELFPEDPPGVGSDLTYWQLMGMWFVGDLDEMPEA